MSSIKQTDLLVIETFFQAVQDGNLDLIMQCVTKGVDCRRARYGILKKTALHLATAKGHLEVVRLLLRSCQVDAEAKDNDGRTALHYACRLGAMEVAQCLIEDCQVNLEARDNDGQTALHHASENDRLLMVRYLIETCNVNQEARNNCQKTALHLASENGCLKVVQYLVDKSSIHTNANDNHEKTALDYAVENSHRKIIRVQHPVTCYPIYIKTYKFKDQYARGWDLPWYTIVIDSNNGKHPRLKESYAYRCIRNSNSKYIPLDVFYYKLILHFQQPQYIKKHGEEVPTNVDQLLFVYFDIENVFRPIHQKPINEPIEKHFMSPQDIRDYHVSVDIRRNGGQRRRAIEEKIEHLRILIQLKQQMLDTMVPPSPYHPMIAHMLESINGLIKDDATEGDIFKHEKQIRDTWGRCFYFSNPNKRQRTSCNGRMVPNSNNDGQILKSSTDQTLSTVKHPTKQQYQPNFHFFPQIHSYYDPKYMVPYHIDYPSTMEKDVARTIATLPMRHSTYITDDNHVDNTKITSTNTPTGDTKSQPERLVPYRGTYQPPMLYQYPYQPRHCIPEPCSMRHSTYITDDDHVDNTKITSTNTPTSDTKSQPEDNNPYLLSLRHILEDDYYKEETSKDNEI